MTTSASKQEDDLIHSHTRHLYAVDEVLSALQKAVRRGLMFEAVFWASELEASGLDRPLADRLTVVCVEDVGIATPLAPILVATIRQRVLTATTDESRRACLLAVVWALAGMKCTRMCCIACVFMRATLEESFIKGDALLLDASEQQLRKMFLEQLHACQALDVNVLDETSCQEFLDHEAFALAIAQRILISEHHAAFEDLWQLLLDEAAAVKDKRLLRIVQCLFQFCHGGGCSASTMCFTNCFFLLTRRRWLEWNDQFAGADRILNSGAASIDTLCSAFENWCQAHRALAVNAPQLEPHDASARLLRVPSYAVDKHTRRGSGMDTLAKMWSPLCERYPVISTWHESEVAKSHGIGCRWAEKYENVGKYSKLGHFYDHGLLLARQVIPGPTRPAHTCSFVAAGTAPPMQLSLTHEYGTSPDLSTMLFDDYAPLCNPAEDPYFAAAREFVLWSEAHPNYTSLPATKQTVKYANLVAAGDPTSSGKPAPQQQNLEQRQRIDARPSGVSEAQRRRLAGRCAQQGPSKGGVPSECKSKKAFGAEAHVAPNSAEFIGEANANLSGNCDSNSSHPKRRWGKNRT